MHEGLVEGVEEAPKKNIDQSKVLKVQVEVMKLMGYDTDEKALEYVSKYAAEYRQLVSADAEVQQALADQDVAQTARIIVAKLNKEQQN